MLSVGGVLARCWRGVDEVLDEVLARCWRGVSEVLTRCCEVLDVDEVLRGVGDVGEVLARCWRWTREFRLF